MTDEQLESIQGDVYLWAIGEIDSYDAMSSICETLGMPHPDAEGAPEELKRLREENTRLEGRVEMFARWCSSLAGGAPLDVQLRMEEHA